MGVSVFSLIVGLFFFTVMALLGSVMLPRATKGGVLLTGVIFVFALARIFIPINFKYTYYIHSEKIYPAIIYLLREELF